MSGLSASSPPPPPPRSTCAAADDVSAFSRGQGGAGDVKERGLGKGSSRMTDEDRAHSLRVAMESIEVGRETAAQLQDQGERLSRSEKVVDSTQYAVDRSAHLLRSMTFLGRIRNLFLEAPTLNETIGDSNGDGLTQGFICPECRCTCLDGEDLMEHYASLHQADACGAEIGDTVSRSFVSQPVGAATDEQLKTFRAQQEYVDSLGTAVKEMGLISASLLHGMESQTSTVNRLDTKSAKLHDDTMLVTRKATRIGKKRQIFKSKVPPQSIAIRLGEGCFLCVVGDRVAVRKAPLMESGRWELHGGENGIVGLRSSLTKRWLGQTAFGGICCKAYRCGKWEEWQCDGSVLLESCGRSTRLISCSADWGGGGYLCCAPPTPDAAEDRSLFIRACSSSNAAASASQFTLMPLDSTRISPYSNGPVHNMTSAADEPPSCSTKFTVNGRSHAL